MWNRGSVGTIGKSASMLPPGTTAVMIERSIGKMIGRRHTTVRDYVNKHHGLRPLAPKPRSEKRLSVDQREEISRGLALGEPFRAIGRRIQRAPSIESREVNAYGGRAG